MNETITQLIQNYGYVAVALLIAAENIFPPIPSELILTFTGFLTLSANLSVPGAIIASTIGAFIGAAAQGGIFAFGIFAHHVKIDIAGLFTRQRAGDAGEQAHRAQVDVLIELAAELQQRPPQRDMIRDGIRPADGAKVDGVEPL